MQGLHRILIALFAAILIFAGVHTFVHTAPFKYPVAAQLAQQQQQHRRAQADALANAEKQFQVVREGLAAIPHAMTAAEKAVHFVYAQIGCPYVWGGTGPCDAGFDCSGLVQAAWAYAGVAIPRTTWEQWAALRKVPLSQMRPGDLMLLLGGDHVGMYVGHGYMINAPQPGIPVQRIPIQGWPLQNLVAVLRP
jgi:cell wall-associated NlpC family hydrolase